ncbi:hypothetical protein [Desulfosporosinus sp. SB140]|uniref:hypothetical protein n=1 Tax=Desulfosporosinus paludis TaxID=3115649 RepID=UPI00388FC5E0
MIDLNALDRPCPKCSGLGRIDNPAWLPYWDMHNGLKGLSRTVDSQKLKIVDDNAGQGQPLEPMFFICKECHGKGKILTDEGKHLIEFVKFWSNPNY